MAVSVALHPFLWNLRQAAAPPWREGGTVAGDGSVEDGPARPDPARGTRFMIGNINNNPTK